MWRMLPMTFGTSMMRPKVWTSVGKPIRWIRKSRHGLMGIDVYIQGLTKICTSVRVRTCMRRGKVVVLMVAV